MSVAALRALSVLVMLATASVVRSAESPLTASERRGRNIYLHGESNSGRAIVAMVDRSSELPASVLACAGCHGPEGRGLPEGTVIPPDIRGTILSRPRIPQEGERSAPRAAYDDTRLARAIREGVDSSGNPLGPVMPRYRIDDADLHDLVAYLKRLGDEYQPGVTETAVTIVSAVPLSGPHAEIGKRTQSVLGSYFEAINRSGGVFGRSIQLQTIDSAASGAAAQLSGILDDDRAFAFVCASFGGTERVVRSRLGRERVPLITPLASEASDAASLSSFFLFPDLESQALALAKRWRDALEPQTACNVWLVHDSSEAAIAAAAAVEREASAMNWSVHRAAATFETIDPPANDSGCNLLFLLGRGVETVDVLRRLRESEWRPSVLVAGGSLDPKLFDAQEKLAGTLFIHLPLLPAHITPEGRRELMTLAQQQDLPSGHLATQIATLATAKLFVEGLKRAGRALTRERLIASLDQLYAHETGLTPPVSFGRGHRVGAPDGFVLAIDLEKQTIAVIGGR